MQPDPAVRPTFSKLVIELSALLEAANAGIIQVGAGPYLIVTPDTAGTFLKQWWQAAREAVLRADWYWYRMCTVAAKKLSVRHIKRPTRACGADSSR